MLTEVGDWIRNSQNRVYSGAGREIENTGNSLGRDGQLIAVPVMRFLSSGLGRGTL
jgi:hypothetical protein